MRGLRRIAGQMRYTHESNVTDHAVRSSLGMPSIDCLLIVSRLLYLGRVERERPRSLVAALHARPRGTPVPWMATVRSDVAMLQNLGVFLGLPAFDGPRDGP